MTRITGTLHEDQRIFMIISRWFLLKIKKKRFQTDVVEKIEIHIFRSITFFLQKIVSFMRQCGKTWQNRKGQRWQNTCKTPHAHCILDK